MTEPTAPQGAVAATVDPAATDSLSAASSLADFASHPVGAFHVACQRLDQPRFTGLNQHSLVPIASMYKVLLALVVADAFCDGKLNPDTQLTVTPTQHTPGGTGLNKFANPAQITLQDLLLLALAWSDNTASDVLLDLIGLDTVQMRAHQLGLSTLHLVGGCRTLLSNAGTDFGYATEDEARLADWRPTEAGPDLLLDRTTHASVADLTRLARLMAEDKAAQPQACQRVRDLMRFQTWKTRFAEAFPAPSWTRFTKTGSLSPWRGEFGIVTGERGLTLAITVVLRQHDPWAPDSVIDAAVRDAAAAAARAVTSELS